MEYVLANQEAIAAASQIVALTPEQLKKGQDELKAAEAAAGS
jgi:hypothetical protein